MNEKLRLRVGVVQMSWLQGIEKNLKQTIAFLKQASGKADLLVFPEANITGYSFPQSVSSSQGKIKLALDKVAEQCANSGVAAVVGSLSRPDSSSKFLNIAHVFDAHGELIYEYAKTHLASSEEKRNCRPGNKIGFFEIFGIKCAIMICRDGRHSENFMLPAMLGAQVCLQPSSSTDTIERAYQKQKFGRATSPIASRTAMFHVVANSVGVDVQNDQVSLGGSAIYDPQGATIVDLDEESTTFEISELDLSQATLRYIKDSLEHPEFLRSHWKSMLSVVARQSAEPVV